MSRKLILTIIILMLSTFTVFGQNITYTVKVGDTLFKIAQKYQSNSSDIMASNPAIKSPSAIYVGQQLSIPTNSSVKAFENEVVRLVNVQRANRGLRALVQNWQLSNLARTKSQDMINSKYFSHISPTYGSPFNMMENVGINFSAAGENIAMGQSTPAQVMNAWMNSAGHRANILSGSYTQIGVGLAKNKNGICYWTQEFINPLH